MNDIPRDKEAIFTIAIEIRDVEQQDAFLDEACGNNLELREQLEKLVAANAEATGNFLESPPPELAAIEVSSSVGVGTQIGPYKLLQKLGEGGCGIVYSAEQNEPVHRRVALKIIKLGMDTGQVIARFEAERQALGMMDHPGIARVFDAGATLAGRPYFVMELVKGVPITQYCDEQHFTPRQRLAIFIQVCRAVQHAHQKGIIHRDLKPQNLLVAEYDQKPVAKVIDFGIAKATNQKLTEKSIFTQHGQLIGTIEYMSPEQAKLTELDVDTRSDVYSLGVVLYELLTGVTPFDRGRLRSAGYDEMLRIIREEDPPKPSTRIRGWGQLTQKLSGARRFTIQKMPTLVHGDLDWIVMKSLEKDRARRYDSASAFADDIERFMADEPIVARPPSALYRFGKFVRRNKTALAIAVIVLVGIVGMGAAWQQVKKLEARAEARDNLVLASPTDILKRVDEARKVPKISELLKQVADQQPAEVGDKKPLNAQIALVSEDSKYLRPLLESMLMESPAYVGVIRQVLNSHKEAVVDELWSILRGDAVSLNQYEQETVDARRFHAGIALAGFAPDSDKWRQEDYQFLAEHLLAETPRNQEAWREQIRPIAAKCLDRWQELGMDTHAPLMIKFNAAHALKQYAADDYQRLATVLSQAEPEVYKIIFPVVAGNQSSTLITSLSTIASTLPPEKMTSVERILFGRQRAGAGITLLLLGKPALALQTFVHSDDPEAMTQFIHGCKERGISAQQLVDCLELVPHQNSQHSDRSSHRYALLLALGEQEESSMPVDARRALFEKLENWYLRDPSSAVHGATGWLLRRWRQDEMVTRIDRTPVAYTADREWFTLEVPLPPPANAIYMTFVVFQPGEYVLGAEPDELKQVPDNSGTSKAEDEKLNAEEMERRHIVRITRPFAILDREITRAEVLAFDQTGKMDELMKMFEANHPEDAGPGMNWYESVRFCRWLTQQAGLSEVEQAFPAEELLDEAKYTRDENSGANGAPKNWPMKLDSLGFRLPTEAEWELACRSGARTAFGHGGDEELYGEYAWYGTNSNKDIHAPKLRKPNLRGLFDIHGNLFEFTYDWKGLYPPEIKMDYMRASPGMVRILRGGCWGVSPYLSRASFRMAHEPSVGFIFMGLRPAMTLP